MPSDDLAPLTNRTLRSTKRKADDDDSSNAGRRDTGWRTGPWTNGTKNTKTTEAYPSEMCYSIAQA
eukprot:2994679-Pyramimonas_sp.AAC.1